MIISPTLIHCCCKKNYLVGYFTASSSTTVAWSARLLIPGPSCSFFRVKAKRIWDVIRHSELLRQAEMCRRSLLWPCQRCEYLLKYLHGKESFFMKETLLIRSYAEAVAYWIVHAFLAWDETDKDSRRYSWQSSLSPATRVCAAFASRAPAPYPNTCMTFFRPPMARLFMTEKRVIFFLPDCSGQLHLRCVVSTWWGLDM